jgi:hypothetical protein
MSNPNDPLDPMAFLNEAIANAHVKNELMAANARIRQLEAEVERLTKAGDAMEMKLQADFNGCPYEPTIVREAIIYWRNAKNAAKNANAASSDDLRRRHSDERGIHGAAALRRADRETRKHTG